MLGRRTNGNRNSSPTVPLHSQSSNHLKSASFFATPAGRFTLACFGVALVVWTLSVVFITKANTVVETPAASPMAFCTGDLSLSVSAHRGGGFTISDMRRSVAQGARAMDIDVWRSVDGVLFVGHLKTFAAYVQSVLPTSGVTDPTLMTSQQIEHLVLPTPEVEGERATITIQAPPIPPEEVQQGQPGNSNHGGNNPSAGGAQFMPPTVDVSPDAPSLPRLSTVLAFVATEPRLEQVTIELKLSVSKPTGVPSASSAVIIAGMVTDIGHLTEDTGVILTYNRIILIDSGLSANDIATVRRQWPTIGIAAVWRSDQHSTALADWTRRLPAVDMAMPSVDAFPMPLAKATIAQFLRPRPDLLLMGARQPNGAMVPQRTITAWMINDHDAFMKALHLGAKVIITDHVATMVAEIESIRTQCSSYLQEAIS